MSEVTTWTVLGDGRYLRIYINKGPGPELITLRSDDLEALAKLNYEIITRKLPAGVSASEPRDYCQLVAEFLTEQQAQGLFDKLVIAAPEDILNGLRDALPEAMQQRIVGEHRGDILPKAIHEIEVLLGEMIVQGR